MSSSWLIVFSNFVQFLTSVPLIETVAGELTASMDHPNFQHASLHRSLELRSWVRVLVSCAALGIAVSARAESLAPAPAPEHPEIGRAHV